MYPVEINWTHQTFFVKAATTNMRYFARSRISRNLVHKKNIGLIWQVVFKLGYLFCQGRLGHFFWVSMNSEKSRKRQLFSINLQKSYNQTHIGLKFLENVVHWSKFKARLALNIILLNFWSSLDLLFSSIYLLFGVYFSLYQRNSACKYKLQRNSIMI